MKDFLNQIRNRHDLFYKIFLFLLSITCIVYFFPKEATFKYEFQKNQPWRYETLIAPYDIPVFRTDREVEQEKALIRKKRKKYFSINKEKGKAKIKYFEATLDNKWDDFAEKELTGFMDRLKSEASIIAAKNKKRELYQKLGESILIDIYRRGIIELTKEVSLFNDSTTFYVYRNNYYAATKLEDVFTPKSAYEFALNKIEKDRGVNEDFMSSIFESLLAKEAGSIAYNKAETDRILVKSLAEIELKERTILKDIRIIKKGAPIDAESFKVLKSFEIKYKNKKRSRLSKYAIGFGQTLLVSILMGCLVFYLLFFRGYLLDNNKNIVFLLFTITAFVVVATIVLKNDLFNVYIVPICLAPIVIRSFFDTRTAFFIHLLVVLLLGFVVSNGFHFVFLQLVAGMMGIYGFSNFRNRSQLFYTTIVIALTYTLCYIALNVIVEGSFREIDWITIGYLSISALLTLLAYPLIYLFEKVFGFISDVTLLELADTNNKLLRELARKAPGTFQHSLQVANLAEAATSLIGGNSLLIRTAALYHDIGKMNAPMYYVENQSTGLNPHDELSYEESAQIIINHVIAGIEIAKKAGIPDKIIDFIRTHHGTTKTGYFFKMYMIDNPDVKLSEAEELFTYPGPIPFSKESVVLMMADSVEAASRSLTKPDTEKIDKLVEGIICNQMDEGQYENADITLRDLRLIKKMFKKMLMNIYHVRIEYPH